MNSPSDLVDAAARGLMRRLNELLAEGVDVRANDDQALRAACSFGHLEVVDRLLAAGANPHSARALALRCAAGNGHLAIVDRLLEAGVDIHAFGGLVLDEAAQTTHHAVMVRLIDAGANVPQSVARLEQNNLTVSAAALRAAHRDWLARHLHGAVAVAAPPESRPVPDGCGPDIGL